MVTAHDAHCMRFGHSSHVADARLVVEADGDYWHNLPGAQARDRCRDAALTSERFKVLRFWEHEIKADVTACVDRVEDALRARRGQG